MLLPAVLTICVLFRSASCDPSSNGPSVADITDSSPTQTTTQPPNSVTLDQVIAELSRFYRTSTGEAIQGPLTELTKTLTSVQESVTALSGRLDAIRESQVQRQNVQSELAKKLDLIKLSQTETVSRLEGIEQLQNQVSDRLDGIERSNSQLSVKLDGVVQSQTETSSRLDGIDQSQSQISNGLDRLEHSQSQISSRLDGVEQSQSQISSRLDSMEQSHSRASDQLEAIQQSLTVLEGLQQWRNETLGGLDTAQEAHSNLTGALSARFDTLGASLSAVSSRVETALQRRQEAASSGSAAVLEKLAAIQEEVNRIPKIVLGKSCSRDAVCSRMLPEAVCGSGGRCQCRDGFRQISDTVCRKPSRLTEWCLEDEDCQTLTSNTSCTSGVCTCVSGFWNHGNTECRRVSAVRHGGSCVGDRDCDSSLHLRCVSGTCSCPVKAVGGYEYRLVAGPSCREGNIQLRRPGGSWGRVCDDDWGSSDAQVVCRSMGFRSGTQTVKSKYARGTNFYMDNVACSGSESHLLACNYRGWGKHNCGSGEVAGVICRA